MNVFDIIGPIMTGPSSSHTAGAVRLGNIANKVMNGKKATKAVITLSGSFARTYRGHGTDKALVAGIMGYRSDSPEIRDALQIADEKGLQYEFIKKDIPDTHPNTACIEFTTEDGSTGSVEGASIGGGNISIDRVNGMQVDFTGEKNTILVMHRDRPGVIADVTSLIRIEYSDMNICNFRLSRVERGGEAIMTIEVDGEVDPQVVKSLERLEHVFNAILIMAI